jgi:hypothetical protein
MFDWQTLEDGSEWEREPEPPGPPSRGWRWLRWGLILLVILAGLGVIYAQLNRRAATVEARLRADVIAAHQVLLSAAARNDGELARSLILATDPAWREFTIGLVESGQLVGRQMAGLIHQPQASQVIEVILTPDLAHAELFSEE